MKLLLSSIVLVTLTVCAQSSVENESNIRVLKSAKGYKTLKSGKSGKVEKSMKSDKVGKAANSESGPSMSSTYIYLIVKAILDLNEPTGSSLSAIRKNMQASLPSNKKWGNTIFLTVLKSMVTAGDLLEEKKVGGRSTYIYLGVGNAPSMSSTYIYLIVKAILDLNEPTGSSLSAIEKNVQASLPSTKKWGNTTFLTALKSMVTAGDLLEGKDDSGRSTYIYFGVGKAPSMSSTYIYLIVKAIFVLNEPTGSSLSTIEKNVQASLPSTTKYGRGKFLTALKSMVTAGDLQEVKDDSGRRLYFYY